MTSAAADERAALLRVGGERVETGRWHEVRSPWSGEVVGRVAWGDAEHARCAIDAAQVALRALPLEGYERAQVLTRTAALIQQHHEELARTITAEAGKPIRTARVEVDRAVATYTAAADAARSLAGEMVPISGAAAGAGKLAFTVRVPVGVVAAITPFNFPLNLVAHKLAPALAAGCPVVLKPAEKTPLTALRLAELQAEAGLPDGWVNVVVGPPDELGDVLVSDERVRLITFTGSDSVGWALRARAPRKKVLLELGNSTPVIVTASADLELAADKLCATAFGFAGQACISVQRILVERPVFELFARALVERAEALVVGDPADEATDVGPVIDARARDRILAMVEEAMRAGARLLTGGQASGGAVVPTVLADVEPSAAVSCREVFGPVVSLMPFDDLDGAIDLANATEYGLQAGIFTADLAAAVTAVRKLDFGGVTINETPTFRADAAPYGGVKASGNTKEGPAHAAREMTEERLAIVQL